MSNEEEFVAELGAVMRDDALLDMLGGTSPVVADSEEARLLLAWRQDIDSEPLAELVDVDTAVRVVASYAKAPKGIRALVRRILRIKK